MSDLERRCLEHYRKTLIPRFTLKCNKQKSSRLLRCPVEVQRTILTMLLHDDEPLGYDVRLSSQLLRTCQTLHRQCKAILYGTNTLILEVEPSQDLGELITLRVPAMVIDIDIGGQCPTLLRRYADEGSATSQRRSNAWLIRPIFDEVASRLVTYYSWTQGEYEGFFVADAPDLYGPFFQQYAVIEQFESFRLDLLSVLHNFGEDGDCDGVLVRHFFGLRVLQDLLEQKTVTINFNFDGMPVYMDKFDVINYVQLCRNLRCKAIDICMTGGMASMMDVIRFAEKVKKSVENGETCHDSWKTVGDLRCEVSKKLNTYRSFLSLRQLQDTINRELRPLHFDARWYSKAICEKRILAALHCIEDEIPLCFQGLPTTGTDRRQGLAAEIREYFRSLITAYEGKIESDPLIKTIGRYCKECQWVSMLLGSKHTFQNCKRGCTT